MLLPFAETILCINCSKLSWKFSAFSIHTFVLIKKKTHTYKNKQRNHHKQFTNKKARVENRTKKLS